MQRHLRDAISIPDSPRDDTALQGSSLFQDRGACLGSSEAKPPDRSSQWNDASTRRVESPPRIIRHGHDSRKSTFASFPPSDFVTLLWGHLLTAVPVVASASSATSVVNPFPSRQSGRRNEAQRTQRSWRGLRPQPNRRLSQGASDGDPSVWVGRFPQLQAQTNGGRPARHHHRYAPPTGETDAMATTNEARRDCSKQWVAGSATKRMALNERQAKFLQQHRFGEPLRRRLRIGLSPRELEADAKAEAEGASPSVEPSGGSAPDCELSITSLPKIRTGRTKVQRLSTQRPSNAYTICLDYCSATSDTTASVSRCGRFL